MLKVALTGNIASGKSTVAEVWREHGARVIDADDLARRAVAPGTPALQRIVEEWGPGIVLPSGELDRAAMRDVVFRDPEERRKLEDLVHPEVNRLRIQQIDLAMAGGLPLIVADIPLLFEAGLEKEFDVIVLVDAPEEVRLQRLMEDRGLAREQAQRMLAAQWPAERKRPGARFVIENRGTLAELRVRAEAVWTSLEALARGGGPG
ncbi:MAG TPA: dephospho-CoA kinase [Longimicrobiaceae bacterium]|nr:dephospho-CoA kinase [Longimicrobiaceae bacterium]